MKFRPHLFVAAVLITLVPAPVYATRQEGYRLFVGGHMTDTYEINTIPDYSEKALGLVFGALREMRLFSFVNFETGFFHFSRTFVISTGPEGDVVTAPYLEIPAELRLQGGGTFSVGGGLSAAYGWDRLRRTTLTSAGDHGTIYLTYTECGLSRLEFSYVLDARLTGDFIFKDVLAGFRYRRNASSPASSSDHSSLRMSYDPWFTEVEILVGKSL